jgi:hypothetical protein
MWYGCVERREVVRVEYQTFTGQVMAGSRCVWRRRGARNSCAGFCPGCRYEVLLSVQLNGKSLRFWNGRNQRPTSPIRSR